MKFVIKVLISAIFILSTTIEVLVLPQVVPQPFVGLVWTAFNALGSMLSYHLFNMEEIEKLYKYHIFVNDEE